MKASNAQIWALLYQNQGITAGPPGEDIRITQDGIIRDTQNDIERETE